MDMDNNNYNPEDIIAREGRFAPRARTRWPAVTVACIDMDILFQQLTTTVLTAIRDHTPLRRLYDGTNAEIDGAIAGDVDALINQGLMELWNRLRIVAETYDIGTRYDVFTRKAPSFDGFALPHLVAGMLSAIGPLRITDAFRDTIVIYAPATTTAANFGRANVPDPKNSDIDIDRRSIHRILQNMRACNLPLGTVQSRGSQGSFFTIVDRRLTADDTFEMVGAFHHSHYTRNDVVMAMCFGTRDGGDGNGNPFENLFLSVGHTADAATIAALTAAGHPEESVRADGPPRHILGGYLINPFGLAPAGDIPERGRQRGIYILGRGTAYEGACSLARDLSRLEIDAVIRHRILHQADGPSTAQDGAPAAIGANALAPY